MNIEAMTKGQKTAKRILEAAARCISKVGIEKTSITAIAEEAELKRSLIAYHYPKKDDIFGFVVDEIVDELLALARKKYSGLSGREALQAILLCYVDFYAERPHYFHCILHFYYLASINPQARSKNTEITRWSLERFSKHLKELCINENISCREKTIQSFSRQMHMRMIGTIMHMHCLDTAISSQAFSQRYMHVFNQELNAFLLLLKARKE